MFVEAPSHNGAIRKISAVISALEHRIPEQIQDRIYNCDSAQELIDEGMSKDCSLRLSETGWSAGKPTYVREPLFLLDAPSELIRAWIRCPAEAPDSQNR